MTKITRLRNNKTFGSLTDFESVISSPSTSSGNKWRKRKSRIACVCNSDLKIRRDLPALQKLKSKSGTRVSKKEEVDGRYLRQIYLRLSLHQHLGHKDRQGQGQDGSLSDVHEGVDGSN